MSEEVVTGMVFEQFGYSPVSTPCKVARVLAKLVVLAPTASAWGQPLIRPVFIHALGRSQEQIGCSVGQSSALTAAPVATILK